MFPSKPLMSRISRRALLSGVALAAGKRAGHAASATAKPHPAPVTVGALFPETGRLSLPGDEAFRGVELAVETARLSAPANGKPIRLIRASASTQAEAAQVIHRLAATDHASLVLGTCSSTLSFAASAAAELANIPYVELDAPADAITRRGFKTLARTGLTTADLAGRAARAVSGLLAPAYGRRPQALRLALLFDVGASDGAFAAAMIAACAKAKLPLLLEIGYASGTMDLSGPVSRMKRAKVDVVIHAGTPDDVPLFYEAMTIAAWRPRMVIGAGSGYGLAGTGFAVGPAIEGTMVVGPPLYEASGESAMVAAMYRRRYAASPRSAASLAAYVGAILAFEALIAGQPMPQSLQKRNLPHGALANGWGVKFSPTGQNERSFATLQQWRGGRLITIDDSVSGHAKSVTSLGGFK